MSGSKWQHRFGMGTLLWVITLMLTLLVSPTQAQFMNLPAGPVGAMQEQSLLSSTPEKSLREQARKRLQGIDGGLQAPPMDTVSGRCLDNDKCVDSDNDSDLAAYMALKHSKSRVERLKLEKQKEKSFLPKIEDDLALKWILSALGCMAVVACGVLPALFLPNNAREYLHNPAGLKNLNLLLSFAVGSLLGDVFMHILPETWGSANYSYVGVGLWIIGGLLSCFLVEKACASSEESQHKVTAIMNLVANLVDNFTHGLAVGGSFLVNIRFGAVTTFAILLHEIPHEISDFAILLRADYDRWSAVKAQLVTALGGIAGAAVALACHDGTMGYRSAWILPFTAGGFLNIALVQVLPELMTEKCPRESLKQMCLILVGIFTMAVINMFH